MNTWPLRKRNPWFSIDADSRQKRRYDMIIVSKFINISTWIKNMKAWNLNTRYYIRRPPPCSSQPEASVIDNYLEEEEEKI